MFLFFKNTVKYSNSGKHFTIFVNLKKVITIKTTAFMLKFNGLGLHCLPVFHTKDARRIWVNLAIEKGTNENKREYTYICT